MTKRKGGIGRKPGRKLASSQKQVSHNSVTAASIYLARKQKEYDIIMETRRQRRIVSPDEKSKEDKDDNEHLKTFNDIEECNTTICQELKESVSYTSSLKVNSKRKKVSYDANINRLKVTLVLKDNIILEKNKEILEKNKEINLIKYSAKGKMMKEKEHSKIRYEEAKKYADENTQKLLTDVRLIYQQKNTEEVCSKC